MPSPMQSPRPRRRRPPEPMPALEVPTFSPQRRLHVLRAFIKPHDWTREAIQHRLDTDPVGSAEQAWAPEWGVTVLEVATEAACRLGVEVKQEPGAEALVRLSFAHGTSAGAVRAVAAACSLRLPQTWFLLGRLAVLDGRFWRLERGYKLNLRHAGDVHVPREARLALGDLLRRPTRLSPAGRASGLPPARSMLPRIRAA